MHNMISQFHRLHYFFQIKVKHNLLIQSVCQDILIFYDFLAYQFPIKCFCHNEARLQQQNRHNKSDLKKYKPMQRQYPMKLRKLFNDFPYILPTQYEMFYSVFKLICHNIKTNDITPQIINQLSTIYNTVKQMIDIQSKQISNEMVQDKQQKISQLKSNLNSSPKRNNQCEGSSLHRRFNDLLQPLQKYFPVSSTAKFIYKHFLDSEFYSRIRCQRQKGEAIVDEILSKGMAESGSMTPLAIGLKGGAKKLLGKIVNERGTSCKIHINGNNQLAVIFWINCFKSDYAVHFDVFWAYFQYYVNTLLTINKSQNKSSQSVPFYSVLFPYPCNSTTKSRIRSLIDPDSKYYITSANCSNLFTQLSEHEIVQELMELSLRKDISLVQKKSQKCLSLKYRWTNQDTKGTVFINSFAAAVPCTDCLPPIYIPPSSTIQMPTSSEFYLTGNSIAHQTKISNNKYYPTIRFGSLNDNEICIKNKYVSRRQFMIIEEITQNNQKETRFNRDDDSFTYNRYQKTIAVNKAVKNKQSSFYLVCLSPTNHTCLLYPHSVQAKSGLIFKFAGVFIQIVHVSHVYKGIAHKKNKNGQNEAYMIKNQSAVQLNLSQSIDQNQKYKGKGNQYQLQSNFQLLTMVPVCKTEGDQQNEDDKTLLELPNNKSQIVLDCQLQCMFISGPNSKNKFFINSQKPKIEFQQQKNEDQNQTNSYSQSTFIFEVKDQKFYLPPKTKILAKRANQVLQGHLSDKVLLQAGMCISLQEIQFQIIE